LHEFRETEQNSKQIALIHHLLRAGEAIGLPLWLESGWAVDARLGRVTREHEDIDLAIPAERMGEFHALLQTLGAGSTQTTDYGFLVEVRGILLDCEPCYLVDGRYELEGVPPHACPLEKQGTLGGVAVRCTSWQAILWEYFSYLQEVPYADWPTKDKASYAVVRTAVGEPVASAWHTLFSNQ
jgi:2''-aminoglycoside nucleotidyltransferase